MLRSSGSLGISAEVGLFFPCIFQVGVFTFTSLSKFSYHLLVENKYINV